MTFIIVSSLAAPDFEIVEDFESYELGSHPSSLDRIYGGTGWGNQKIIIDLDDSRDGEKSFYLEAADNWAATFLYNYGTQPLKKYIVCEIDIKPILGRWATRVGWSTMIQALYL